VRRISGQLPGELRGSQPEALQTALRRACAQAVLRDSRKLSGELLESSAESLPAAVRRASRQPPRELPGSCAESFQPDLWRASRELAG